MTIISKNKINELNDYIAMLETFCAYSINDLIHTFDDICENPKLFLKWRWRTAVKLYRRATSSIKDVGDINHLLQLSGYFNEPIDDGCARDWRVIDNEGNIIQPVKDIDRIICKRLCEELATSNTEECTGEFFHISEKQRFAAISELQKPLEAQLAHKK